MTWSRLLLTLIYECRFEGLTRDAVPHGKGTMTFGKQGKGAGIPNTKPGDRYEGEFHGGFAHGVGMFTSADGVIFKGEFSGGLRDGCGGEYNLKAWHKRMKKGMDPAKAWREAKEEIQDSVVMGTWNNDVFTTGPTDLGTGCSIGEMKRAMCESDSIVARARMFQFKPGGDVRPLTQSFVCCQQRSSNPCLGMRPYCMQMCIHAPCVGGCPGGSSLGMFGCACVEAGC